MYRHHRQSYRASTETLLLTVDSIKGALKRIRALAREFLNWNLYQLNNSINYFINKCNPYSIRIFKWGTLNHWLNICGVGYFFFWNNDLFSIMYNHGLNKTFVKNTKNVVTLIRQHTSAILNKHLSLCYFSGIEIVSTEK